MDEEKITEKIGEIIEEDPVLKEKEKVSFTDWARCREEDKSNIIMNNSPGGIISTIILNYKNKQIKKEGLVPHLVDKLGVEEARAEKIKEKIETKIFPHISSSHIKEKPIRKTEEPKEEKKKDPYREPIA